MANNRSNRQAAFFLQLADFVPTESSSILRTIGICNGDFWIFVADLPRKSDVDQNYIRLMRILLASGHYHAFATHDPRIIEETRRAASDLGLSKEAFEFQMLYGIGGDLQDRLVREGYRVRVYIPFGQEWFSYFMRRLAERPANVLFVLKNLWR